MTPTKIIARSMSNIELLMCYSIAHDTIKASLDRDYFTSTVDLLLASSIPLRLATSICTSFNGSYNFTISLLFIVIQLLLKIIFVFGRQRSIRRSQIRVTERIKIQLVKSTFESGKVSGLILRNVLAYFITINIAFLVFSSLSIYRHNII